MDNREFRRLLMKAHRRYQQTKDFGDHGFTAIMDELVMECDDDQWQQAVDSFDTPKPEETADNVN